MSKTFFSTQQNTSDQREATHTISAKVDSVNSNIFAIRDSATLISQDTSYKIKVNKGFTFTDNDSLAVINNFSGATNTPALFKGHELKPSVSNPIPLKKFTPDWFTIALFCTIGFFTWLKIKNNKIFQQLFAAFFNNSVTNQIVRDENILVQKASVLMSLVFYFTAALFFYQISVYFNWEYKIIGKGLVRFIIFVLFIATAYSFKMVFLKMMSIIFRIDRAVSTYIFNIFLINNIIGILLIPVVMLIAFFPAATELFIWMGILMIMGAFLYRLFRGIVIWTSIARFSLYYLILYLCALEIAPVLIIFKLA